MVLTTPLSPFQTNVPPLQRESYEELTLSPCGYWAAIWHPMNGVDESVPHNISAQIRLVSLSSNNEPSYIPIPSKASTITWVPQKPDLEKQRPLLLLGFQDGTLRIVTTDRVCASHKLHSTCIESVFISNTSVFGDDNQTKHASTETGGAHDYGNLSCEVWILFRLGTLVCVPMLRLLSGPLHGPATLHPNSTSPPDWNKWHLKRYSGGTKLVCAVRRTPRLFEESTNNDAIVMVVGGDPVYTLYVVESVGCGGQLTPDFGQLATAVASKVAATVTNIASRWGVVLNSGSSASREMLDPATCPSVALDLSLSFRDPRRIVTSVQTSPCGNYVASCDRLGRVCVVEISTLHILRMWKGYRNAQCAWLTAPRERQLNCVGDFKRELNQPTKPWNVYLVLYAPQRSVLETWSMPLGMRSGVLKVDRLQTVDGSVLEKLSSFKTFSNNGVSYWTRCCFFQNDKVFHVTTAQSPIQSTTKQGGIATDGIHKTLSSTNKVSGGKNDMPSIQQLQSMITNFVDGEVELSQMLNVMVVSSQLATSIAWQVIDIINELDEENIFEPSVLQRVTKLYELVEERLKTELHVNQVENETHRNKFHAETPQVPKLAEGVDDLIKRQQVASGTALLRYITARRILLKAYVTLEHHYTTTLQVLAPRLATGVGSCENNQVCWNELKDIELIGSLQRVSSNNSSSLPAKLPFSSFLTWFCVRTRDDQRSEFNSVFQRVFLKSQVGERNRLANWLFLPLLADVFAASTLFEVTQRSLVLENQSVLDLFYEWWFSQPITLLLMSPTSDTPSSQPVICWLSHMLPCATSVTDHVQNANQFDRWFASMESDTQVSHALLLSSYVKQYLTQFVHISSTKWEHLWQKLRTLNKLIDIFPDMEPNTVSVSNIEHGDWSLARTVATWEGKDWEMLWNVLPNHKNCWPLLDCVGAWVVILQARQGAQILKGESSEKLSTVMQVIAKGVGKIDTPRIAAATVCHIWPLFLRPYFGRVVKATLKAAKSPSLRYPNTILLHKFGKSILKRSLVATSKESMLSVMSKLNEIPKGTWPPILDPVTLRLLQPMDVSTRPNQEAITNHLIVLEVVHHIAIHKLRGTSIRSLFPTGTNLVTDTSLFESSPDSSNLELVRQCADHRRAFLGAVLQASALATRASETALDSSSIKDERLVVPKLDQRELMKLADILGVSREGVRREYVVALYWLGKDLLAEDALKCVDERHELVPALLRVAEYRMHAVLQGMQSSSEFASVLAMVSSDTVSWVRTECERHPPPALAEPMPSLSAAHALLLQLDSIVAEVQEAQDGGMKQSRQTFEVTAVDRKRISELLALARTVYQQVSQRSGCVNSG